VYTSIYLLNIDHTSHYLDEMATLHQRVINFVYLKLNKLRKTFTFWALYLIITLTRPRNICMKTWNSVSASHILITNNCDHTIEKNMNLYLEGSHSQTLNLPTYHLYRNNPPFQLLILDYIILGNNKSFIVSYHVIDKCCKAA